MEARAFILGWGLHSKKKGVKKEMILLLAGCAGQAVPCSRVASTVATVARSTVLGLTKAVIQSLAQSGCLEKGQCRVSGLGWAPKPAWGRPGCDHSTSPTALAVLASHPQRLCWRVPFSPQGCSQTQKLIPPPECCFLEDIQSP